jgi:hypothetical protein
MRLISWTLRSMIRDVTMTAPVTICGLDMVSDQDVSWDAAPEPPATPAAP